LARALAAGGLRVLEVTMRTPVALAAVEAMRKAVPEAIVGVGTLTRAVDFAGASRAGAQFGVTPGLTPELAAAARGARFPLLPGVMTPTELIAARAQGFTVLKLFPAQQAGGIGMLQALGAPFPMYCFVRQAESRAARRRIISPWPTSPAWAAPGWRREICSKAAIGLPSSSWRAMRRVCARSRLSRRPARGFD
jgi:2-keto-3-deoxy-6-phosphogluconate aldolase